MNNNLPASFYKYQLTDLYAKNSNLIKNRMVDKEVNNIKYQVLEKNNLGHKAYTHNYSYEYDTTLTIDDYFSDILNKLVIAFPDSEISYKTSDEPNNKIIYNNSSTTNAENRRNYSNNGNKKMNNTITIDWTP